jgi:glyoxylase-like metal-dependent hydrolase (beta-lactamase superfamily II)
VVYRELRQFNPGTCVISAAMHVERFESALWQTASLLLVADGESVAVDPCISSEEVAIIAARAQAVGAPVSHVLATHADWDHVCGIAAFPDAVAAMGERSAEAVASGAPAATIAQRAVEYDVAVAGPPRVDRPLAAGVAHRVGPFVVETVPLPGHTADGTGYRVRALDALIVGDHLSAVEFPFVSSTADYRMTLAGLIDVLRHDPPAQVVPGHGPALTAAEALAIAEADLAYLRALHEAVAGAIAKGANREQARAAGLAVDPPREATADLAPMRESNVRSQLNELLPT